MVRVWMTVIVLTMRTPMPVIVMIVVADKWILLFRELG